jgi:hypothetical protein
MISRPGSAGVRTRVSCAEVWPGRAVGRASVSGVKVPRGSAVWARRGIIAVVLIAAAVIPGRASSQGSSKHCLGSSCTPDGSILWTHRLPGRWVAENGVAGTVPVSGDAYVTASENLAVLADGTLVAAYDARTGEAAWDTVLTGFAPGAVIVSVRAWSSVVAVGVEVPAASGSESWREAILSAATGLQLRSFPSSQLGGAVWAGKSSVVIVGTSAVTSYATTTGHVLWRRGIGRVAQAWKVSGRDLYVEQSVGGYLSASPVTALRRIDLQSGSEQAVRPDGPAFAGTLVAVVSGVALFSGASGLSGYSAQTGRLLWPLSARQQTPGTLELIDSYRRTAYVSSGNALTGLDVYTGQPASDPVRALSASLYAVTRGVALGLDQAQGDLGEAWGYDVVTHRVVWTSAALPWPHFFVDPAGLGGSVSSPLDITLLTTCAAVGTASGNNAAAPCLRPELAAIRY